MVAIVILQRIKININALHNAHKVNIIFFIRKRLETLKRGIKESKSMYNFYNLFHLFNIATLPTFNRNVLWHCNSQLDIKGKIKIITNNNMTAVELKN